MRKWSGYAGGLIALGALAATTAAAQEEEPFWAKGRPKTDTAMQMAPVPAPPLPTAREDLPDLSAPAGFKVEIFADGVQDARAMREGADGTVYVSSLFVAGKIYALTGEPGAKKITVVASDLMLPSGLEYRDGDLYVATPKEILRYKGIDGRLDNPPEAEVVFDNMPGEIPHGWKTLGFGPDGKLYYPVGAPCNICEPSEEFTKIFRINADGTGREVVVNGMRNSVGFDFHPRTGELWFTDNQRDWLTEDTPYDELNRVSASASGEQDFGYPYCHGGEMTDPEFGWGKSCDDYQAPAATFPAHSAPLGMRFYDGDMFPEKYRNAIFIAQHGPWNRTEKFAAVHVAFLDSNGNVTKMEPFLTGFVKDNAYLGRPADVMVMSDGSLLVSDDHAGAIYRVSYGE